VAGELPGSAVGELFDRGAEDYDRLRRRLVPCLDEFYGAALAAAAPACPAGARLRVLDLGAGTGLLSARFAAAYPRATFTLVDVAEGMLSRARERFAGAAGRFRFAVLDYAAAPLPQGYHLIISGLSIHHLAAAGKRDLFRRCFHALRPGGAFVNADQVAGPTAAATRRYLDLWRRHARAAGATEGQLAAAAERMQADRPSPLADQLAWLNEAGFEDVDCWYKWGMFAVFAGYRPRVPAGQT
jgi:tRNA (cmo5U34)-methyltransferase